MMREELIDIVLELEDLPQFELLRFHSLDPGNVAHVEVLYGYAGRWMQTRMLSAQGLAKYGTLASRDYLLVHCDGEYFDAAPYLHSQQDITGHHTQTLVLKQCKSQPAPSLHYEVSGQGLAVTLPEGGGNPDMGCLAALF